MCVCNVIIRMDEQVTQYIVNIVSKGINIYGVQQHSLSSAFPMNVGRAQCTPVCSK